MPDKLAIIFQQNHFGIYKIDRPNTKWERIGDNMPSDVGDIGFPIAIHPNDFNLYLKKDLERYLYKCRELVLLHELR